MQSKRQKIAVIGLGHTGRSCLAYLSAQGADLAAFDTRAVLPDLDVIKAAYPGVPIRLGPLHQGLFDRGAGYDQVVVSPGVAVAEPAIAHAMVEGVSVVGDIELFCQASSVPRIAITGSNAKSTVTSLVGLMAQADGLSTCVAGNIGEPVLTSLQAAQPAFEQYVLELSSFQLETTFSLAADVASILNITPDHMDRYSTFEAYADAKRRIYSNAKAVVFNRADVLTQPDAGLDAVRFSFGLDAPVHEGEVGLVGDHLVCSGKRVVSVAELRMPGRHNVENALAAIALGAAAGFSLQAMRESLRAFAGLSHRCQWVAEAAGVNWYNDSKGTNVGATIAALKGLSGGEADDRRIVLIAGGAGKGADFTPLAEPIAQTAKAVLLLGESAAEMADVFKTHDSQALKRLPIKQVENLNDAVQAAQRITEPGDSVLLSPACASFDMFQNYQERGERFVEAVSVHVKRVRREMSGEL